MVVDGGRSSDVNLLRRLSTASKVASADSFDLGDSGNEFDISGADEWVRCEADEKGWAGKIRYVHYPAKR